MYSPSKSTWLNPNLEYLFDAEIIEYDMRDAGYSLVKEYQLLPREEMIKLEALGKGETRHIAIGVLQRDNKEFSKTLSQKFADIRAIFISANGITDDRIISVKKDAIYTIGVCKKVKFGGIIFASKNTYSSYIRFPSLQNLEIYYSDGKIDIKGMGESAENRHRLYMIEFIRKVIRMIESKDRQTKRFLMRFIDQYKTRELDEGYYLEFNNLSRDINPVFNYQNVLIPLVQIVMKEID